MVATTVDCISDEELVRTKEWAFVMTYMATRQIAYRLPGDLLDSLDAIELASKLEDELGIVIHDDDVLPGDTAISIGQLVRLAITIKLRPEARSRRA